MLYINELLRARPARILFVLALAGTAAEFLGPVLAAGLGVPLVRLAAGETPSPWLGALEAGAVAAAVWWTFEA